MIFFFIWIFYKSPASIKNLNTLQMIIKDIYKFINSVKLFESMSKKEFKKAIKGKDYSISDMETALEMWRSNPSLKRDYELNKYVDNPQKFIDEISDNDILRIEAKLKILRNKLRPLVEKDFLVLHEDDEKVFLAVGNPKTNHYLAVNYLRQKNDGEKFGSGPTWCIAHPDNGAKHWNDYDYGHGSYPCVYMLLSKKDSRCRFQLTFKKRKIEEYLNGEEEYLAYCFDQVRDFAQDHTEETGVFRMMINELGVSIPTIEDWLEDNKEKLKEFNVSESRDKIDILNHDIKENYDDLKYLYGDILYKKLFNTSENIFRLDYNKLGEIQSTLANIYLRNKKNINLLHLKALMLILVSEWQSYYFGFEREILKTVNLSLEDISKVMRYMESYRENIRETEFYSKVLFTLIEHNFKNNPVSTKEINNKKLSINRYRSYFNVSLETSLDYDLKNCLNGNVIDIINNDLSDAEKIHNCHFILSSYYGGVYPRKNHEEKSYKLSQIIRDYFEQKREETTPIEDIMMYYYLDDISFEELKNKVMNDRDNFLLSLNDERNVIKKIKGDEKLNELFNHLIEEALKEGDIQKSDVSNFLK